MALGCPLSLATGDCHNQFFGFAKSRPVLDVGLNLPTTNAQGFNMDRTSVEGVLLPPEATSGEAEGFL